MAGPSSTVQYSLLMCIVWGAWFPWMLLADQGGCRRLKFVPPVDGKRLESHIFLNLSIGIYTPCEHRCLMESRCVSVNIGPSMENDKVTCELNDADHLQFPDDLKDHPGWRYRGTENPCSRNPCFHNGTCVSGYSDKRFICLCLLGYTGEHCERDIDECAEGSHDCHKDATCINTAGHFNCSCNLGHTGNGRLCSDIDECTRGTHNCSDNAVCNNTKGSHNCTCRPGFEGDGQNCQDVDECSAGSYNCSAHAVCTNTKGSYNCTCKPGYYGDGKNCQKFTSCKELYDQKKSNESKAHPLYMDNQLINVFCLMTAAHDGDGTCGEGGWTLALKTDGHKSTFGYNSTLWKSKEPFGLSGGETGFDANETKLPTYWNTSFSKICLGMKIGEQINFIVINKDATSLYSMIADGTYRNTLLGRATWKSLAGTKASLQRHCNMEGFNANGDSQYSKARIGIIGNNEIDCTTCDSRIGFGTGGYPDDSNTCGNESGVENTGDNGDQKIRAMGYIFVQ